MATIDLSEVESRGNVFIPQQVAVVRIIEAVPKLSREARSPMAMLTLEIVKPESIEVDGEKIGVAGLKLTHFVTYGEKGLPFAKEFHKRLGLSMQIDPTSADDFAKWKGLAFEAEVKTEVQESKDEQGNPVIDPSTGQPITRPSYKVIGQPLRKNLEYSVQLPY